MNSLHVISNRSKRCLLISLGVYSMMLFLYWYSTFQCVFDPVRRFGNQSLRVMFYRQSMVDVSCYSWPETALPVIDESFEVSNKTIFFVETSCKGGLDSRQCCAIESAALANPGWRIVVLVAGPLRRYHRDAALYTLSSILNIHFARISVNEFSKGTPLHSIFVNKTLLNSSHPVVHSADILRILVLHKFGGVYLDLDVIVMKSFDTLPKNFIVKESASKPASGVLGLSKDIIGGNFTKFAVSDLAATYHPKSWGGNGPYLILRTLKQICDTKVIFKMSAATCKGMHVLEPPLFFPIYYQSWRRYYMSTAPPETAAYAHHVWNALGSKQRIPADSMFARLAARYCPNVHHLYGHKFGF